MSARLSLALAKGEIVLPDGRILLLRPPVDLVLDGLPLDRSIATHGLRPLHDALAGRGMTMGDPEGGSFAGAIVFAQRARDLTFDLLAQAIRSVPKGAPIILDGGKTDGIEAAIRQVRRALPVDRFYAKDHGKCVSFAAPADIPEGWAADLTRVDGFVTRPGVFSADGPDPGSVLLAAHLPSLDGAVCDLGAGWGFLGRSVLASASVTHLDCVEAERLALDCARQNLRDDRVRFHWADATGWVGGPYDAVVTNPPFHTGRSADPGLGQGFIAQAGRILKPTGRLWLVANRRLPYEATLSDGFAEVFVRAEQDGYKVIEARKPRRRR